MTHRQRFRRLMSFQPVDRLPAVEWAGFWDQTIDRWHREGLPAELTDHFEIRRHLGLDPYRQMWIGGAGRDVPAPPSHGAGIVADRREYQSLLPRLYPDPAGPAARVDLATLRDWAGQQARGEIVVWISLDGFFWFPRQLLGIQRHLFAFYDQPDVVRRINADLLAYNLRVVEAVLEILTPDFVTIAEDFSYNHGPMISRELFEQFMAPYYRQLTPALRAAGVRVFVDTDGDITDLVEWMLPVGVEGFLPLERMAGVDVSELRRRWPRLLLIGGFDKTVMHRGQATVRGEFCRLLPVMRQGGFIASVDHQTPPGVSLCQYRQYLALLAEYCRTAADEMGEPPAR